MHIAGGHYRLVKLISQFDNFFVNLDQILFGMYGIIFLVLNHKPIVSKRLNLQIIVKAYQPCNLRLRCIAEKRLVKLSCLTGTSNEQALSVSLKNTLWDTGSVVKILDMGLAYQLVKVDPSSLISHENNCMIGRQLLDCIRGNFSLLI